jgi:hypothetical protein
MSDDPRRDALRVIGSAATPAPASADVEAVMHATIYVGDQVRRVADGIDRLCMMLGGLAKVAEAVITTGATLTLRLAAFAEEVAPAVRNGAGEVVGRTVNVAAAIRADEGGNMAMVPPDEPPA